ncbi:MAG: response regulator [Chitinophagaceae bacterium]|nr:response regulator [Chitinophagaceae bacterium]
MHSWIPDNVLESWTVVVIDDEPDALEVAKLLLEMYGAQVITASNGKDGLKLIHEHHPRFVVSDISMPEMSGWDLIDALKADRKTCDIPTVALTAHAMTGDREKAIAKGFHNYLTKPLRPETFVEELLILLTYDIPELKLLLQ